METTPMVLARPLRPLLVTTVPVALLIAACSVHTHDNNGTDASITIGNTADTGGAASAAKGRQSVSISVPGFSAKVNVPDLDIGSDTKIANMPMFPGTKINGVDIVAHDSDGSGGDSKGDVDMAFTAPANPSAVVNWYKDQAQKHGWNTLPPTGTNQFEATRQEDGDGPARFALQIAVGGGGSIGHFHVSGH
jgi:hypothetical protein